MIAGATPRSIGTSAAATTWPRVCELAVALADLGYRVRVFTRGRFADRSALENAWRRLAAGPIGGRAGRRDENAVQITSITADAGEPESADLPLPALGPELDWLEQFIRREAAIRGRTPWEHYDIVCTHDWDAGLLGTMLIDRWRDDVAAKYLTDLLSGALPAERLRQIADERHERGLGAAPAYHLGAILLGEPPPDSDSLMELVAARARCWARAAWHTHDHEAEAIIRAVQHARSCLSEVDGKPPYCVAAAALGEAILRACTGVVEQMESALRAIDRHIWVVHTLARRAVLADSGRHEIERQISQRVKSVVAASPDLADRLLGAHGVNPDHLWCPKSSDLAELASGIICPRGCCFEEMLPAAAGAASH